MRIHCVSYPISSNVLRIVLNVHPLSCERMFLTFSRNRNCGFFSRAILAISKKSVPLASLNPRSFPATLNDWQGKPPVSMSKSGSSLGLMSLASLYSGSCPKFFAYVFLAYSSISQAPTHSCPFRSSPSLNPPTPQNKSKNFIHVLSSHALAISFALASFDLTVKCFDPISFRLTFFFIFQ